MLCEDVKVLAHGLRFPEGPIALGDGSVLVVEMHRKTLSRVDLDGSVEVVANTGGGPNGAALGPDGAVYICNNGGPADEGGRGCIQRVDMVSGDVTVLYDECDGRPLLRPNDLVFDHTGGFWFTDHGHAVGEEVCRGAICYARPDGSLIRRVVEAVDAPNGIGLSPDESVLYWAQTALRQVVRRQVAAPGALKPSGGLSLGARFYGDEYDASSLLVGLPGNSQLDSLAIEANGAVCVGTLIDGVVTVVFTEGQVERMTLPPGLEDPFVTNICFGGADLRTAYLTLTYTGRLVSCRWPRPGLQLNFQQEHIDRS